MECKTCAFYQATNGLITDAEAGLCMVQNPPAPTLPTSGANCTAWRPIGYKPPVDYSVRNITEETKLAYQLPEKTKRLNIQAPPANSIQVGNIIKISWPDEWVVSAIGRASLLAFNQKTGIEKQFSLSDTSIQKER